VFSSLNKKRVIPGAMVKLLPCGQEVMDLNLGSSLSTCMGKAAYIYPTQTPFCGSLVLINI